MVSEGVDIPRLRVGVYATSARTELFFRQVVGRFIRRTPAPREQMSHLFLPSDPALKRLAAQIEEERNHALTLEPDGRGGRARRADAAEEAFRALWSSARRDDDVLQTTQPGEALQLFAERLAVAVARAGRLHDDRAGSPRTSGASGCATTRRTLVARWRPRTGETHGAINARINRDVGAPSVAKSTVDQLERANALLERAVR